MFALQQMRVLDLTTGAAGAYATRVLADFGAEVFRVEDVRTPDTLRSDAIAFESLNRNKRSLALDLSNEAARALCLRLASLCDFVFVTDADPRFRRDELLAVGRGLLLVVLGGDDGLEAEAGLAGAAAALTALFYRRQTGEGQCVAVDGRDVDAGLRFLGRDEETGSTAGLLPAKSLVPDAQLRRAGFFEAVARRAGDVVELDGVPYRFSRTPAHIRLPAPLLGEHNDYVLGHYLGLDAASIAALRASGIVGPAR